MTLTDNPLVTGVYRSTLRHQVLVVVLLVVVLALSWNVIRTIRYRRMVAAGTSDEAAPPRWPYPEPVGRRCLRLAFGILWVFDGLLMVQGSIPASLPGGVLIPSATSSPGWVRHLVSSGATIWSDHPVTAAAATMWIEIGIGVFLLVAPRGYWSRSAGAVSAGWGLVVWVFGEAFGGIFAPGSSWLFGTPGAALLYVVAGVLVALPDSRWETARLGKGLLRVVGVFFIGMGVLQAWPGRGFWSGQAGSGGGGGTLTAVLQRMARVPQPSVPASLVRSFASFDAAHGWAVNAVVVVLLIGIGVGFVSGDRRLLRPSVIVGVGLCLTNWVLVQDVGFLGGAGTDPNSMIPLAVVFTAGYLAVVRLPAVAGPPAVAAAGDVAGAPSAPSAGPLDRLAPSYLGRLLAALGAVGVVLLGAAPMALAAVNPTADAIVTEAADGTPNVVDLPAPPFTLTDQSGRTVSLRSLGGHVVVLTFLDPVCTTDCPLIAQELRVADRMLGAGAAGVDLVAVDINPLYDATTFTSAFDAQEGLDRLPNWIFLTGPLDQLESVWDHYGAQSAVSPAGAMIAHNDIVYVIDRTGRTRVVLDADPGDGTAATESSFSALLSGQVQRLAQP